MKSIVALLFALVVCVADVFAADPLKVKLWPDGAPTKNGFEDVQEEIKHQWYYSKVSDPELWVYLPEKDKATGQALLVVPGGAYKHLCMPFEGVKTAEWLTSHGIVAVVLKYRLPNGHYTIPLEDGQQAMRMIRANAGEWGINPSEVGAIGFSAGGHFVSNLLTAYEDSVSRPDYGILLYPVISMDYSSARTRENLLGNKTDDPVLRHAYSTQNNVHAGMPDVMIMLADDDDLVVPDNGIGFYQALKGHGVHAEMHIYPVGGHGFWMHDNYPYADEAYGATLRWINAHRAK